MGEIEKLMGLPVCRYQFGGVVMDLLKLDCLIGVHLLNANAQSCTIIERIWSGCGNLSIRCASLSSAFLSLSQKSEHLYMLDSILGDSGT